MSFDAKQRTYRHRNEITVALRMSGSAEPVAATVFASLGERASDLMNDARAFIPVRLASGETMIVEKSQIASIVEAAAAGRQEAPNSNLHGEDFSGEPKLQEKPLKSFDVYAALKIAPTATNEEVRTAYKARMKEYHPDKVAHLGQELQDLAHRKVLEIQAAYARLRK